MVYEGVSSFGDRDAVKTISVMGVSNVGWGSRILKNDSISIL